MSQKPSDSPVPDSAPDSDPAAATDSGPPAPAAAAPPTPGRKGFWRRPLTWLASAIGIIASTSTVIALVGDWVDPDTSEQEQVAKLDQIERKLDAEQEDGQLVNQVSLRVSEFDDAYDGLRAKMKDVRELAATLAAPAGSSFETPAQRKRRLATRAKERQALLAQIERLRREARRFIDSVEGDQTLAQVQHAGSESARNKSRALAQARTVREQWLAELDRLAAEHGGDDPAQ
jgi:hypothetical protein